MSRWLTAEERLSPASRVSALLTEARANVNVFAPGDMTSQHVARMVPEGTAAHRTSLPLKSTTLKPLGLKCEHVT